MRVRRLALVFPITIFLVFPNRLSPQTTPAVSAGTKLGTFIRDAVNAALPEVNTLVKTLFPKTDSSKDKDAKQGTTKGDVEGVGQECPTHTCNFRINRKGNPEINPKVKGVGQECPTHTSNFKINRKGSPEINRNGQECWPTLATARSTATPSPTPSSKARVG